MRASTIALSISLALSAAASYGLWSARQGERACQAHEGKLSRQLKDALAENEALAEQMEDLKQEVRAARRSMDSRGGAAGAVTREAVARDADVDAIPGAARGDEPVPLKVEGDRVELFPGGPMVQTH